MVRQYSGPPVWIDVPDQLMVEPPVTGRVEARLANGLVPYAAGVSELVWNQPFWCTDRIISFKRV